MNIRRLGFRNVRDPESVSDVIVTVPDEALSVRDILHRFTRGQIELPPAETGDSDDIDDCDLIDEFDAYDMVRRGFEILNDFEHGQKDKDVVKQDIEADMPPADETLSES